jgi:hypothetical protein
MGGTDATNGSSSAETEELARLRAERDALRAQLTKKERQERGGRGRTTLVVILVLLSCLAFTLAVPAVWTRRTLSDTDRYVATVAPIIENESVTDALSLRISDEVITVLDPETVAADALPERAQILASPIANAVEGFIEDRVNQVVASDRFAEFWANANRFVHSQIQAVLRGDDGALVTQDGQIVLNLIPVINEVLERIEASAGNLLGKDVTLPDISDAEVPEAAREKLESALGIALPADLGQIVIYEADKLQAVRDATTTAHRAVFLVFGLMLIFTAAALWVSKRRRRTLLQLSTGMLVGLVIVRRSVMYAQDQIVDLARNRDAAQAIVDDLMRGLFSLTQMLMIVLLLVIVIALITGPYGWAVSLRRHSVAFFSTIVETAGGVSRDDATVAWVRSHHDALKFGGIIVGVLFLLLVDVSWVAFFVLVGLIVLWELAVSRITADEPASP